MEDIVFTYFAFQKHQSTSISKDKNVTDFQ